MPYYLNLITGETIGQEDKPDGEFRELSFTPSWYTNNKLDLASQTWFVHESNFSYTVFRIPIPNHLWDRVLAHQLTKQL